jgi:toxin CcdB
MAQFDVHQLRPDYDLVVDCQSDLFEDLPRRFVVPLLPEQQSDVRLLGRLTPVFEVRGERLVFAPPLAGTATVRELGPPIASLERERDRIIAAIDALITGI